MKRRALISATAVMLVAIMCLVTASYAWFTASGDTKIETFNVEVGGADSALELSENNENWRTTLTKDLLVADGQKVPSKLTAVSTGNGTDYFATTYANGQWTSYATTDGYILIDFFAKAPSAGTATLNIGFDKAGSLTDAQLTTFKSAVKVGYFVGSDEFKTYDLAIDAKDTYQPVIGANAVAVKTLKDGTYYFEPLNPSDSNFSGKRTQTLWNAQNLTFSAGETKHFTVAIWLEGQDKDCVGSFDMSSIAVNINFANWTPTAA